jgi:hypothetical protein
LSAKGIAAVLIVAALTFTASFIVVYEFIQPFQAPTIPNNGGNNGGTNNPNNGGGAPTDGGTNNQNNGGNNGVVSAQVWELTNDMGQTATVIVQPFSYSGTFTETSNSDGWWVLDAQGNEVCRLNLGGNIFHDSGGDRWEFVNYGGQGGGYQVLGTAEGTANGNFPYATSVSGTCQATINSPMGSTSGQDTWTGVRIS